MKGYISLLFVLVLVGVTAGTASARQSASEITLCPDSNSSYESVFVSGNPLKTVTVANPCDYWLNVALGDANGNTLIVFYVAPGTSATVSNSEFVHDNLAGLNWNSVQAVENRQTTSCPAQLPGSPSYIIEADGSLQPFSCT
jgi:hypothetical protein